jgi:hypothetical protein
MCARALPLRVATTRARFGRQEPPPGLTLAERCGAPPRRSCSGALAATRRVHASSAIRSRVGGLDQNGLSPLASVHRGPMSWAHDAVHHHRGRCIKDPRLNQAVFRKEPLGFLIFTCRSFHL